ncbi:MAG: lipopolysaccharide biosynthesis protein [Sphingorhabdus sp.]
MNIDAQFAEDQPADFGSRVKSAVFWRSGTQILAQLISWGATLAVIRILDPSDYGLFAMTSVVLVFLNFLNGYGFVSALIQSEKVEPLRIRQAFGMLILLNGGLALIQLAVVAPLAAAYFEEPVVAAMLRWQSLIYLATPFLILPEAMLTRNLEFKKPAIINLTSAFVGAVVALTMALNDYGVWTLVFAPIAIFWTRAIALMLATRFWIRPSFNFRGAGNILSFGTMMLVSHGFWIIQSQIDIFIAGRYFDNHDLGLYAEALFLTQIFAAKFVPPLNEVAFPAYARLQNDRAALSVGFLKAVRLIMLISCPFYVGMAVTAGPLVEVVMGPKWIQASPLVAVLSLAMPVMTLQILFHPALNALGLPQVTVRNSIFGAVLMPTVYLYAVQYDSIGLAWGWLVAFPILLAFTIYQAKPHIGFTVSGLLAAVIPGLSAALAMGAVVWLVDRMLMPLPALPHLAILVATGGLAYTGLLWFGARQTFMEVVNLVIKRKPPEPVTV